MNYTYLAVLSTDDYLTGALVLHESLKRTQPKYPFAVLITKNISSSVEEALRRKEIRVIKIDDCILLDAAHQKQNENVGYKYWNYTFDSLYIFGLTEFDKIVYLDCDVIVLENLDHLFDKPHLSACLDPGSPNLSSGIMVIEPRTGAFKELMDAISEVESKRYYFGDQNVIQECY
ncbi:MAG: glycosyltransferase, partial [Bacillota bacterium]|nr:glycosyltransferase [Bacillota bacterium]